mgnify:FL=1
MSADYRCGLVVATAFLLELALLFGAATSTVAAVDIDGDGIDDANETGIGTDVDAADTDGDGIDDTVETSEWIVERARWGVIQ